MDSKHIRSESWRLIKWLSALIAASWLVSSLASATPGEGFEVRGPLKEASSDGRSDQPGYFSIGSTVLMLPRIACSSRARGLFWSRTLS
jgi:hypothetical protein